MFYNGYLSNVITTWVPTSHCVGKILNKGTLETWEVSINHDLWVHAHLYVIYNNKEVKLYLDEHITLTKQQNCKKNDI